MANKLCYSDSKIYVENSVKYRIKVCVSLDDDCHNNHCDWHVTGDIDMYENGKWVKDRLGCIHEEISEHFPELVKIVRLHLSGHEGIPLYAVENGYYHAHKSKKEVLNEYLRVTEEEASALRAAPDEKLFKYLLFSLGIVERWAKEGAEAIAWMEDKTGQKWENPYTGDEERSRLVMTDDERTEIEKLIASGYYKPDAIAERKEAARVAGIEKKKREIIDDAEKTIKKATDKKNVYLFILAAGLPTDNVIYYDHLNKVVFNWIEERYSTFKSKITASDLEKLNDPELDRSLLPEGLIFEIKQE